MDQYKDCSGTESGRILDRDKDHEGREMEIKNMQKLEVDETNDLAGAKKAKMDTIYTQELDDEDEHTREEEYTREDVMQDTPPIEVARMMLSMAASAKDRRGQHTCLVGRHDIRTAIFDATGSGKCWGDAVTD